MVLAMTKVDQQHVACSDWSGRSDKTGLARMTQPVINKQIAQAVAQWCDRPGTDGLQRGGDQPDAVKPGRWVAPMKPERAPDELPRRIGQRRAMIAIRVDAHGWPTRDNRSLPGRNGSPRKLIALANRPAQVRMV